MLNLRKQNKVIDPHPGGRVELIHMDDPYTKLKEGDKGTIDFIDDANVIHVKWDNGSTLGLLPDVDKFKFLSEYVNKFGVFPEKRDHRIGARNEKLHQQAEEELMSEDEPMGDEKLPTVRKSEMSNSGETSEEEEVDPFEGKERRFRVSIYADVHVPMTADIENDRQVAEQEASEILKKLSQKSVSNIYLGGVANNPFGKWPDDKEFSRL
jgi:hypothetical protein